MADKIPFTARERAFQKIDLRAELERLEHMIADLKVQYEQYFSGLMPLAPDKLHNDVKRKIRELLKAPLKNHSVNYKLKTLEGRYGTFNNYWQRVLKQREEGTYNRDVFKANLRERNALEDAKQDTEAGKAEGGVQALFRSYREALEKTTGQKQDLNFDAFKKSLVERAKEFKAKNKDKKVSFKVVVENGQVKVKAKIKSGE